MGVNAKKQNILTYSTFVFNEFISKSVKFDRYTGIMNKLGITTL